MKFVKKLFVLFLVSMLLASTLSISAFASEEKGNSESNEVPIFRIDESFTKVTLGEEKYIPIDATFNYEIYTTLKVDYLGNNDIIKYVDVRATKNKLLLDVSIHFVGGTSMNVFYIDSDYADEYSKLISSSDIQIENFPSWDSYDPFCFTTNDLKDATSKNTDFILEGDTLLSCVEYAIVKKNDNFTIIRGFLIIDEDGNYYYADCEKSEIFNPYYFSIYSTDKLNVYKLKDSELLSRLKSFESERQYEMDGTSSAFAIGFLSIFCGIIPLVIAILCFVFSFNAKKSYKKVLRVISLLCIAEIILLIAALVTALS
ncbi:MAG: hypothetical protein E7614_03340 [Ruminococcaceae bacterium]|nr:hypothetical protein [Oscillospiraceae bacterium]